MSDEQYYYLLDGKEHGPFSRAAIESLVKSGKLDRALIKSMTDMAWMSIEEISFEEARATPIPKSPQSTQAQQKENEVPSVEHWIKTIALSIFILMLVAIGYDLWQGNLARTSKITVTDERIGQTQAEHQNDDDPPPTETPPKQQRRREQASNSINCREIVDRELPVSSRAPICGTIRHLAMLHCENIARVSKNYMDMMAEQARAPAGPLRDAAINGIGNAMDQTLRGPSQAYDENARNYRIHCL